MGQAARTSPINLFCSENSSFVSIWIKTIHNTRILYHSRSSNKGLIQEHVGEKAEKQSFMFYDQIHYILYPLSLNTHVEEVIIFCFIAKYMPASEIVYIHKTINIYFKYCILNAFLSILATLILPWSWMYFLFTDLGLFWAE